MVVSLVFDYCEIPKPRIANGDLPVEEF